MNQERDLQAQVLEAIDKGSSLRIVGGNSKAFYGRDVQADADLSTLGHSGVIAYEPSELVITARSGTPLHEIEALLAEHDQQLPFEPPDYSGTATLGGAVAAGLSGPRRMYAGAVRDSVLGVKLINGKGEVLSFGGQVMKNVAGYDVSRLVTGSLGTLGVLLEVSIKTRPAPLGKIVIKQHLSAKQALITARHAAHLPITLTASAYDDGYLYMRLCGAESALESAKNAVDGVVMPPTPGYWTSIKNHTHPFFETSECLWRVSLPNTAALPDFDHQLFMEWNGQLRWLKTDASADTVRQYARQWGGHATRFHRAGPQNDAFQPLSALELKLHQRLKQAMDPQGLFNPGRLYAEL